MHRSVLLVGLLVGSFPGLAFAQTPPPPPQPSGSGAPDPAPGPGAPAPSTAGSTAPASEAPAPAANVPAPGTAAPAPAPQGYYQRQYQPVYKPPQPVSVHSGVTFEVNVGLGWERVSPEGQDARTSDLGVGGISLGV